jgi:hypothetical protein
MGNRQHRPVDVPDIRIAGVEFAFIGVADKEGCCRVRCDRLLASAAESLNEHAAPSRERKLMSTIVLGMLLIITHCVIFYSKIAANTSA